MLRARYILLWLVLLLPVMLQAEYYVINNYKVDIKILGSEGIFEVKESITVAFSEPRHGIYRFIPTTYRIDNKETSIKIYDVKVSGFQYDTYQQGSDLIIKIGSPDEYVEGIQTYNISYKVKKGFMFMENWTEFYWNLTGNEADVPIGKLSYSIQLDKSMPMDSTDYFISTGSYGARKKDATISYYLNKFSGETTRSLNPREGVTVGIKLPLDYVKRPSKWELLFEEYGLAGIGGLLFLFISVLFYRLWSKYGKDYPIIKAVEFQPPKELTPSEAGVIIDEKADDVDILALLPFWANNGKITIERIPKKGWLGKDDHILNKISNLDEKAAPYERIIFNGLFDGRKSVSTSSLENTFYEYLKSGKASLKTHVEGMGVYYPISIHMQIYVTIASVILAILAVLLGMFFSSFILTVGLGLGAIAGMIAAANMLKKNEYGVKLYQQVLGFKMFVKSAEKDRIERLLKDDPDYFEKTLPYAMIFGYAKEWSSKFDGLLLEPPKWYVTQGGYMPGYTFMPSDFGQVFDSGIRDIQSAFSSVPASSGGGGFSGGGGGGFSGGGFGGGGTGSW
jgi:uncharacterized membrane protein YgcG